MLFPTVIDVEIVRGLCNARCIMCSIESPKVRPGIVMTNQRFEQILDSFEPYAAQITQVNLVGMGEPLLDPQVCSKVRISKRILPLARVAIITNAALLSPQLCRNILEARCDDIILSIDSTRKDVYERIRIPLKFEKTLENVHHFIKERNKGSFKTRVMVRMIEQELNRGEWQEYVVYWQQYCNPIIGDMILLFPVHKWPKEETEAEAIHLVCPYVFERMSITANGEVQLCCVDIGADFYPIGSLFDQDPISVFNGKFFSMVRSKMTDNQWQDLRYCNTCDIPLVREKRRSV